MFNMLNTYIEDVLTIVNTCSTCWNLHFNMLNAHYNILWYTCYTYVVHVLQEERCSTKMYTNETEPRELRDENTFVIVYTKQSIYQIVCPILSSQKERYLNVIFHLESSPHAILLLLLSLQVGVTGGLKFGSESSSTILRRSVFEKPSTMISRHTQKGTTLLLINGTITQENR